jgi:hypothetical protein
MDPRSLLMSQLMGGAVAVVVIGCLAYSIHVSWPLVASETRSSTLPKVRFALFGGVLFTSLPFLTLLDTIAGHSWTTLPTEMFFALLGFSWSTGFNFGWVLNFIVGYAFFAFVWSVYSWHCNRRVQNQNKGNAAKA